MATNFDQHTCPVATSAFEVCSVRNRMSLKFVQEPLAPGSHLRVCLVAFIRTPKKDGEMPRGTHRRMAVCRVISRQRRKKRA